MHPETALAVPDPGKDQAEARLIGLVLDGVTSKHSLRSYRTGLKQFFAWIAVAGASTGRANDKHVNYQYDWQGDVISVGSTGAATLQYTYTRYPLCF